MKSFGGRLVTGLSVITVLLAGLLLDVTPAAAGVGGSDTPTWPASATVGDLINTSVLITNTSTAPNNTETVTLTTLFVTPACADSIASTCLAGNEDPGIFKVVGAIGDASTAPCAGVTFTIGAPVVSTGEVALTPTSTITLGAVTSGVNLSCQVNLQLRVFAVPANPAPGPPATTDPLTRATLHGVDSGLDGSGGGAAQIVIAKGTATVASLSNPNSNSVAPGTSVTDTATVTHATGAIAPTGSVRFILCQPNEVTGAGCPGSKGTVVGSDVALVGGSATSAPTTDTTAIGKYCWRARYLGDANYNPSNHTDPTTECFTTVQPLSNTTTTSNPTGGNVATGASVTDAATVSGPGGQPTPTGTVTFFLCQPATVTGNGGDCSAGGAQVGVAKTLDSNGQATSDASTNTATVGKYCWRAEYSGDALYSSSAHTDGTLECFTTVKRSSNTTTLSSPTGGNVAPGTSVTDAATVSGGAGQPTPTGTVTFFLCQPATVTANGGDCSVGGAQVGAVKTLNGSGQATSDASTNTTTDGKYCWRADYSGDANYNPSTHTDASGECFTVVGHPHLTLAKTPDNAIYTLGDTISFTLVVKNTGDATAHNVQLSPADALPDPTASLNWGPANPSVSCTGQSGSAPSCTVSGAIGSQVLNCNFGDLAPNGQCSATVSSETPTAAACVPSPGLVNQGTVVDDEGDSASDTGSQSCNPAGCRITGGPNGGQVGAPCGCIGGFLEFDHVQGNWNWKTQGGKFKAFNFNSLTCGCDVEDDGSAASFANGQVCGDRNTGPTPPAAPANVACFTGTGRLGSGGNAVLVAFRFEVRDHGEPGVLDENRIQVWIPTGQETAESIAEQVACTNACSTFRVADIDEGVLVNNGNIQIHRDIAPHEGICPVPAVVCPEPPGDGICPFDP